ncbi:transferrin-binding protein-like solute binding protein [Neisseria weaveri]|uniref:transferrin-binding protein-like solute binding protein n=1 Tax=Neisseria weaveri TaxID=28091 RepID=UPI001900FE79|nr:transferrin-binding protein-like solute binding protein [Neisseria weaveri]
MQQLKTLSLCSLTAMLTACAGGSFDTLNVNPEPPPLPEPPKVEKVPEPRQNPEEQAALKQPAAGFVMKGLRRNRAKHDQNGNPLLDASGNPTEAEIYIPLNPNDVEAVNDADLTIPKLKEMQNDPNNRGAHHVYHTGKQQEGKYQYIRFGHVTADYPEVIEETVRDKEGDLKWYTQREGWNVHTFYHGTSAAASLPVDNNVNYRGEWYFMSDVKKGKGKEPGSNPHLGNGFNSLKGNGDIASATGQANETTDKKYTSDFTVNFSDKSMTGGLHYESRIESKRKLYDIEAQLNGNRFTGKALSKVNDDSSTLDKAFFAADSNLLEGGFYGPEAQELAGKFLANDNSLFVVFGAKRDSDNPNQPKKTNALLDAFYITVPKRVDVEYEEDEEEINETDTAANDALTEEDFTEEEEKEPEVRQHLTETERKPLANFGYAMKLRFGNKVFDLEKAELDEMLKNANAEIGADTTGKTHSITLPENSEGKPREFVQVCCSNLSYLRFGQFVLQEKAGQDPVHALYLQGERTPVSDLPQSGKATYLGSWTGFIKVQPPQRHAFGNPDYGHNATMKNISSSSRSGVSSFDVDFDNKKLNGALIGTDSRRVFNIEANINGSGFTGRGYTDGSFPFDPGNLTKGYSAYVPDAKVEGGFYGPGARELGGTLIYNSPDKDQDSTDIRAGAVFGATKQE